MTLSLCHQKNENRIPAHIQAHAVAGEAHQNHGPPCSCPNIFFLSLM